MERPCIDRACGNVPYSVMYMESMVINWAANKRLGGCGFRSFTKKFEAGWLLFVFLLR